MAGSSTVVMKIIMKISVFMRAYGKQEQVGPEYSRDGAARSDHGYVRGGVVDELKQRCRSAGEAVKNDESQVPRGILYIVSEDPKVEHVAAEMKETPMEKHRCKYSQHVIRQQFRAPMQGEQELLGYKAILDDELLFRRSWHECCINED